MSWIDDLRTSGVKSKAITDDGRYQLNTIALDMQFDKEGTKGSHVDYSITGGMQTVTVSDENFSQATDIVSIDTLEAKAKVTQPNPKKPFNCNFSFSLDLGIKIKLPDLNAPPPNFDLLYSIREFTEEVSKLNDDIIYALRSLNCCDLENAYNKTIVPFFRWFADHKDIKYCSYSPDASDTCGPMFGGNTFPMVLYNIAETLVRLYIVVRPLICLLRPVPGNPWWPFDLDQTYFIKFLVSMFDIYYDLIISGKLFDITFTDFAKKLRHSIEVCLFGSETFQAADLNLSIVQYRKLLQLITDENNKLKSLKMKLNKTRTELTKYLNGNIFILYEKQNDILDSFDSDTSLLTVNDLNSLNNDKYLSVSIQLKDLVCKKSDGSLDDSQSDTCIKRIQTLITPILLILIDESYNAKTETEKSLLELDNITKNNIKTQDDLYEFAKTLNSRANDIYKNKIEPLNTKITNLNSAIKIKKNFIKKLNDFTKQHEQVSGNTPKKEHLDANMSGTFLTKASIKKMANNNNICDCLISALEALFKTTFRIPMPEDITDISKTGFSKVEGKESFKIKFKNIDKDKRYELFNKSRPSGKKMSKTDKDNSDILYTEDLINVIVENFNNVADSSISIGKNSETNKYIMKIFSSEINLENIQTAQINAIPAKMDSMKTKDVSVAYLRAADDVFDTDLRLLYSLKYQNDSITIPDENGNDTTINYTYYEYDNKWIPNDVYPSGFAFFKKATSKLIENIKKENETNKNDYNTAVTDDKNNKNIFCTNLSQRLNYINLKINKETSFTKLMNYKMTQNHLKLLQESLCLVDIPFELDNNFGLDYMQSYLDFTKKAADDVTMDDCKDILNTVYNDLLTWFKGRYNSVNSTDKHIILYFKTNNLITKLEKWLNVENHPVINEWVWEKPDIPCTCDGVICKLIQAIINSLLSSLTRFIQHIFSRIMDLFWKSPIGKIIKFIIAKIKCVMILINVKNDLNNLNELVDALQEELKNNIKLYTDPTICLNNAINDNNFDFPIQYDPNTNTVTVPDTSTPQNLINDIQDIPSITGNDINDPNYEPQTINVNQNDDGSVEITSNGGDVPEPLQPEYPSFNNFLPATLILTPQVNSGPLIQYPNHKFPLLTFNCPCEPNCEICNEETKEETIEVLQV